MALSLWFDRLCPGPLQSFRAGRKPFAGLDLSLQLLQQLDRPFVAIYLNDPAITREVHRRTEVCVPVIPLVMPLASNDDSDEVVFSALPIRA